MADDTNLVTPPANVQPSPAAPVTGPQDAFPVIAPPSAGSPSLSMPPPPGFDPNMWRQRQMGGIVEAYGGDQMKAVQAATRFMAQQGYNRKYQQDIQAGMSPQEAAADALAEYGPSLFFQPGAAVTPGNVASFIRAVRPQPVKAPTANPIDVTEARGIVSEMSKIQSALDDNPTGSVADDNRGKLQYLRGQLEAIRAKYNTNAAPPAPQRPQTRTAVSAPAGQGQRIRVRSKDGKIGTIPASQLDEALAAGYTRAQ